MKKLLKKESNNQPGQALQTKSNSSNRTCIIKSAVQHNAKYTTVQQAGTKK